MDFSLRQMLLGFALGVATMLALTARDSLGQDPCGPGAWRLPLPGPYLEPPSMPTPAIVLPGADAPATCQTVGAGLATCF